MLEIFVQSLLTGIILFLIAFRIYQGKSKRWGGAVIIVVFVATILLHRELEVTKQLQGVLEGGLVILLFGLLDDWKNFSWKIQLTFQIFLVGLLLYFGFQIDYFKIFAGQIIQLNTVVWQRISILSAVFVFFWVVGIINAINWSDGSDSVMGAIALTGGLSLFFVSLLPEVNQPAIAILASIFLGVVVSFLIFNIPPAKIEAGTSGSYFVGFILASLAIMAGSKIITVMVILLLPLLDFLWVIAIRWRKGKSIFQRDKNHLHHRLQKIGWSDLNIFFGYVCFLGSILVGYFYLSSRGERIFLLLFEILAIITMFIVLERKLKNLIKG